MQRVPIFSTTGLFSGCRLHSDYEALGLNELLYILVRGPLGYAKVLGENHKSYF